MSVNKLPPLSIEEVIRKEVGLEDAVHPSRAPRRKKKKKKKTKAQKRRMMRSN